MRVERQWLAARSPKADPAFRLICIPYAGGSAAIYRNWQNLAPDCVDVCAIELPGHGSRMGENPFPALGPLVSRLASALEPVCDRPYAIFGHSMGGLIAFELARNLRRRGGRQPAHLFISATAAPDLPIAPSLTRCVTSDDVRRELRHLAGTPQTLLDNDQLMTLLLPAMAADFSVLSTYRYCEEPPLHMPITVFGGTLDHIVAVEALSGWRRQSALSCRMRFFRGDHFYLHSAAFGLVMTICDALAAETALLY